MRTVRGASLCAALVSFAIAGSAVAGTLVVRNGESIQAAVDAAKPGDTIFVRRGVYTGMPGYDSVVTVRKDDLTIRGGPGAVIDARGFEYGIMVGEDEEIGPEGCPPITVLGFTLQGMTIKNADDTGVRLSGVDGFSLTHSIYLNNFEYGPFPVCSRNGRIDWNFASGHNDAAIYVGDDLNVDVAHNVVTDSVAAIEIENSSGSEVEHNVLFGNTAGVLVFVGPNLPMPFNREVLVAHNRIFNNNRDNTGRGAVAAVPSGSGILVIGSDNVSVRRNRIAGNRSFGLALIGNVNAFFDSRIEPFNDGTIVDRNWVRRNGFNPDTERTQVPGADIIFLPDVFDPLDPDLTPLLSDPDASDNCFAANRFGTDFPAGVVGDFPCP